MTSNQMLAKSPVRFNTGLYSFDTLSKIQDLLLVVKTRFGHYNPSAAHTAKYYSLEYANAAADMRTGEIIIFWCKSNLASWRDNTEEVFKCSFRSYKLEDRMAALAQHIKTIVCKEAGGSNVWRQPDAGSIEICSHEISLRFARYIYELLLHRSNISKHYPAEFLDEVRGNPIDPIKQQMLSALVEQIKETRSNAENAVKNAERERQNAWDTADQIFKIAKNEIRLSCDKKITEIKEQLVALAPQFADEDL